MDVRDAEASKDEWVALSERRDDPDQQELVEKELQALLEDLVPDAEHWTVIRDDEFGAMVLALAEHMVYRVTYSQLPGLDRTMFVATGYLLDRVPPPTIGAWVQPTDGEKRHRAWLFRLAPDFMLKMLTIEIRSGVEPADQARINRDERFARALARRLGWQLPVPWRERDV